MEKLERRIRNAKKRIEEGKRAGLAVVGGIILLWTLGGARLLTVCSFKLQAPVVSYGAFERQESVFAMLENSLAGNFPLYRYCVEKQNTQTSMESPVSYELCMEEEPVKVKKEEKAKKEEKDKVAVFSPKRRGDFRKDAEKKYSKRNLKRYSFLLSHFYHVDSTAVLPRNLVDYSSLFYKDLTLSPSEDKPRILLYHTHAHEEYRDTKKYKNKTVVDVGKVLKRLLEEKYGIKVLHHKGVYDDNRNVAYSKALPNIEKVLKDNPSIEMVIDLHRDGIDPRTHLVTEVDGKKMATLMFFNGISYSKVLGPIAYLENKNLPDNLALSLQMKLAADTYYEGLARGIYIKSYRYNMHLKGRDLLVEVGAQNNTYEEAKNAMEPLADLLDRVLTRHKKSK